MIKSQLEGITPQAGGYVFYINISYIICLF